MRAILPRGSRPSLMDPDLSVPVTPPDPRELRPAARIGREHPYRINPTGTRLVWPFTERFSVPTETVGTLRSRITPALERMGFAVRSHGARYYRPSTDPEDWVPDEYVWAERSVMVDRSATPGSNAIVYGLYAGAAALVGFGALSAIFLSSPWLSVIPIFLAILLVPFVWIFSSNVRYWSDFVLLGFQRSPTTPPRTKDAESWISGEVRVSAGRLFSNDVQEHGGHRRIRELYHSAALDEVLTVVRSALSSEQASPHDVAAGATR